MQPLLITTSLFLNQMMYLECMNIALLGYGKTGKVFHALLNENVTVFDPLHGDVKKRIENVKKEELKDFDFVVNLLPSRYNELVLNLIKNLEVNYMDFSTFRTDKPEQLDFKENFKNRLALLNVGIAPGLDNLLVAEIADNANWIKIFLLEHQYSLFYPSWSVEDMMLTLEDKPLIYKKGKFITVDNFSDPEVKSCSSGCFWFYRFFGEEILSLALNVPNLNIELKAGGSEIEVAKFIYSLKKSGGGIKFGDKKIDEEGVFGILIESDYKNVEVMFPKTSEIKKRFRIGNHITFPTALMGTLFLKHAKELKGMYFPEELPEDIRKKILNDVKKYTTVFKFY